MFTGLYFIRINVCLLLLKRNTKLSLYIHLLISVQPASRVHVTSQKTISPRHPLSHSLILIVSFHCPLILYCLNYIFISFLTPLIPSHYLKFISLFLFFNYILFLLLSFILLSCPSSSHLIASYSLHYSLILLLLLICYSTNPNFPLVNVCHLCLAFSLEASTISLCYCFYI